jgi:predicted alpha/beta-hydrolase family hydrolase
VLAGGTPAVHSASVTPKHITIDLDGDGAVSGLWLVPPAAQAAYVFAHGAGAGMAHKSMTAIAEGLATRGVATLRFNFLYMERGSRRPDSPALAHQAVRAAVAKANDLAPKLPLFAGGKSFGGRMTSQAQALQVLAKVRGLVFFGFPLHPAGKPSDERAKHLDDVEIPMLFLQGANDALAEVDLLEPMVKRLGKRATLSLFEHADHSFHVPAKSGRKDKDVLAEILEVAVTWMLDPARP